MPANVLPNDRRFQQGGWLFLGTLLVFFLSSLLLYFIYASGRRGDVQSTVPLPNSFLTSTICLLVISGLVHWATRTVRRSKRVWTASLLGISAIAAVAFMAIQYTAMLGMLGGPAMQAGTGKGVAGMVVVLAFLHALHVAGGVIALAIVSVRSMLGRYDHERHWPVDFAAQYWHFLDLVWLCMLASFVATTGGFQGLAL
ncbi:cytochrome c oxidase subunit 3 [Rhodopirellula sp. JC740]|uniref:Cytochrome c oxidase subunit 3 n=1 Tax=Rhodopirellula halodulae TaxID=2894198 RepID=A0ABS8NMS4_9BACT|nr:MULTISPECIES: cytochrome c oxidase subunit 3 [unclassified Rhodopirellula]MCC9644805.1 cytochrome c oxidase subunit 3 [Rhodopirellula sp. JC740]MCC9658566.1 cytochrome c oxidase subunit 3 [Rhodopirellula sp. JC737]